MENIKLIKDKWEELNLSKVQSEWDEINQSLKSFQDNSINSRKELASSTKAFIKLSDKEKISGFKNLFKSYQTEIDNLTQRCKFSEQNWLENYKKFINLSSPSEALEFIIEEFNLKDRELNQKTEKLNEIQSRVDQLLSVNIDLQAEFNDLKVENDALKGKVDELETLQQTFDSTLEEQINIRESELQTEYSQKFETFQEREQSLLKQIKEKLLAERYNLTLNQLNLVKQQNEELQLKFVKLKDENKGLTTTIEQLKADPNAPLDESAQQTNQTLKNTIEDQEDEINKLITEVNALKLSQTQKDSQFNLELKRIKDQLETEQSKKVDLQQKLDKQKDYDKIQTELNVLKGVEFGSNGQQNLSSEAEFDLMSSLKQKNDKLQAEITNLKQSEDESKVKLTDLESEQSKWKQELKEKTELVRKLEADLLAQSNNNNGVNGTGGSRTQSPNSTPVSPNPNDQKLVTIITGQRDRFRSRNLELEEELNQTQENLKNLSLELNQLKFENLKLFEKLKYKNQFQTIGTSSSTSFNEGSKDTIIEMQTTNNIHKKYEEEYNLKNNPFKEFNQREQSKRYRQLHPIDRLVLNLTRLLTMNRYTRFGLLGYIVLLHLLVFFITWHKLVFKGDETEIDSDD
ncbi:hypothetical protein CONCODRAFT_74334 [Conidiobolus coronatus NRRL 28638]|uniref:Protein CASP n=1 Tax=Conidiobolus coronatus (strain ATCC 28846 / CBS 209.66 / NRRL 28638) TaxID=796925 RepID=A0A137NRI3_CONC2|nr:hypothetical protein CONCODRAFT_74334 [Conidiobolus coronatus NRRL 28638]|eukprot:KXN65338.1 hypothetical protein CONCODRAFT_74334 [Conidiobolus coronatus NRRL 28638]